MQSLVTSARSTQTSRPCCAAVQYRDAPVSSHAAAGHSVTSRAPAHEPIGPADDSHQLPMTEAEHGDFFRTIQRYQHEAEPDAVQDWVRLLPVRVACTTSARRSPSTCHVTFQLPERLILQVWCS